MAPTPKSEDVKIVTPAPTPSLPARPTPPKLKFNRRLFQKQPIGSREEAVDYLLKCVEYRLNMARDIVDKKMFSHSGRLSSDAVRQVRAIRPLLYPLRAELSQMGHLLGIDTGFRDNLDPNPFSITTGKIDHHDVGFCKRVDEFIELSMPEKVDLRKKYGPITYHAASARRETACLMDSLEKSGNWDKLGPETKLVITRTWNLLSSLPEKMDDIF